MKRILLFCLFFFGPCLAHADGRCITMNPLYIGPVGQQILDYIIKKTSPATIYQLINIESNVPTDIGSACEAYVSFLAGDWQIIAYAYDPSTRRFWVKTEDHGMLQPTRPSFYNP